MRRLALALLLVVVAAGCSDDGEPEQGDADDTLGAAEPPPTTDVPASSPEDGADAVATVPAAPSIGCGGARPAGGATMETLPTADGLVRSYRRYVPPDHDGTTPLPLVLGFHGLTGGSEQMVALGGFEAEAETATGPVPD